MRNRRDTAVAAVTHSTYIKTILLDGFYGATEARFAARMTASRGDAVKPLGEGGSTCLSVAKSGPVWDKFPLPARPPASREIAIKHHP